MDNSALKRRLVEGSMTLGIALEAAAADRLLELASELLRWNARVNLTAITALDEVVEKHLIDSLACVPVIGSATSLLDLGAGAGFPGLPVKVARPELAVTLVDAVAKKVAFIKHAAVVLKLARVRAIHARAAGVPEEEGLPRADVVLSRALMDVPQWLKLARPYLTEGGRVIAMTGRAPANLESAAVAAGLQVTEVRRYVLPFSGAERHLVTCRV